MGHPSASPRAFPSEAGAADSGQGPEGQKAAFELGPTSPAAGNWLQPPGVRTCLRLCPSVRSAAHFLLCAHSAAWWRQERLSGCQALALTRAHLPRVAD